MSEEFNKNEARVYWFKRKLYGWGWVPATWQGGMIVALYVFFVIILAFRIDDQSSILEVVFTGVLPIGVLTAVLVRICYKKGEKPRWQWGSDKGDGV